MASVGTDFSVTGITYVYQPDKNVWKLLATSPDWYCCMASASAGGDIYAFGGERPLLQALNTAWEYAPAAATWEQLPPMPRAERYPSP